LLFGHELRTTTINPFLEAFMTNLELKVCERCGALWLRKSGEAVAYCGPCRQALSGFKPQPALRKQRRPRAGSKA
jgi:hypothetical protein